MHLDGAKARLQIAIRAVSIAHDQAAPHLIAGLLVGLEVSFNLGFKGRLQKPAGALTQRLFQLGLADYRCEAVCFMEDFLWRVVRRHFFSWLV